MTRYDPSMPLYFCHIPRTGGAILVTMLIEMIGKKRTPGMHDGPPGPGDVPHGHYDRARGLSIEDRHPGARQTMTIIRDPFDRMVSWYFYIKNLWHGHAGGEGTQFAWDIRLSDYGGTLEGFLDGYPPDVTRFLPAPPMSGAPDDFVFVGLTSRMGATVRFLSRALGAPMPSRIRHGNPCGKKDEPVTKEMRRRFRAAYPEDHALYDHAVEAWSPLWKSLE